MDREKQPTIFNQHNITDLADEVYARERAQELVGAALMALCLPDEKKILNTMGGLGLPVELVKLREAMIDSGENRVLIEQAADGRHRDLGAGHLCVVEVDLFCPHSSTLVEEYPGVEATTSVVALNAQHAKKVLLFKMAAKLGGEPDPQLSLDDISLTNNCVYGGVIDELQHGVKFFRIIKRKNQRKAEETMVPYGEQVELQYLKSNSPEYQELLAELEAFVAHRNG